jgi:hypothetical protein
MKAPLLFLFILIGYSNLWAQEPTLVTIKTGTRIRDVIPLSDILLHPQFISGNVFFRNGSVATGKMNYNSLIDQMLFIDPNGDTLALKDEKTIKFITLGKDTFYYADGFVRLVASNSVVKLAEKKIWELADVRKIGSHNRPATTFAVTPLGKLTDGFGRTYDLVTDEEWLLRKQPRYYFGDTYDRFLPAGKNNLLSFFPKMQNALANYLKENKVNFHKKDDLEKIAQFLAQNY